MRAIDAAGNPDVTPATRSFTVDTVAPDTSVTGGASGATNQTQPVVLRSPRPRTPRYECRLDTPAGTGGYSTCTSPQAYTTTANGTYTFSVRATDAAGNVDASPATRGFTRRHRRARHVGDRRRERADRPDDASPSRSRPSESATYECRLDTPAGTGSYTACTSPQAYTTTANGGYTFSVRASDAVGNTDASPATRSFTRRHQRARHDDHARRERSHPGRPTSRSAFTATEDAELRVPARHARRRRRLQRLHVTRSPTRPAPTAATRSSCAPPTPSGTRTPPRDPQLHRRHRRTRDLGDRRRERADEPDDTSRSAFTATETARRYECRLDTPAGAGGYSGCTSPQAYTTTANGTYTFSVRATDAAGNADALTRHPRLHGRHRRAGHHVHRRRERADEPDGARRSAFDSTEAGSTLPVPARHPGRTRRATPSCSAPWRYTAPLDGAYTFSVRATDAAGNPDGTPADPQLHRRHGRARHDDHRRPHGRDQRAARRCSGSPPQSPTRRFLCRLDGPGGDAGQLPAVRRAAVLRQARGRALHVLGARRGRGREHRQHPGHPQLHGSGRDGHARPRHPRRVLPDRRRAATGSRSASRSPPRPSTPTTPTSS